jgi:hypothetical protein
MYALGFLLLALLCCAITPAQAHGYMYEPISRNWAAYQANTFYDPQSGNGLGTGTVAAPGKLTAFHSRLLQLAIYLLLSCQEWVRHSTLGSNSTTPAYTVCI